MPRNPRDYQKEQKYDSQPHVKKKRAERNAARAKMMKEGKVQKGDGKDVDHKNGKTSDNRKSNLQAVSKTKNRSYSRTKSAGKKNPRA